jgi:hypothetical protein
MIFPVVLYKCETWSLTLEAEHRLRVFENRLLRKIFGSHRDVVVGGWRKLQNTELHDLYPLPNIIKIIKSRRMRLAGHVTRMVEKGNACRILVGKPEGKRLLESHRHRLENNAKMDLGEIGWGGTDWIWLRIWMGVGGSCENGSEH